jgi:hypothetical protein
VSLSVCSSFYFGAALVFSIPPDEWEDVAQLLKICLMTGYAAMAVKIKIATVSHFNQTVISRNSLVKSLTSVCNLVLSAAEASKAIAARAAMLANRLFENPRFYSGVRNGSVISSCASASSCSYRFVKSRLASSSAVLRLSPATSGGSGPKSWRGIGLSLVRCINFRVTCDMTPNKKWTMGYVAYQVS